jgi:hypothetical protein
MEQLNDLICLVHAGGKSKEKIDLVLNHFIPNYQPLDLDYMDHPIIENYEFQSETEIIEVFLNTENVRQLFFWKDGNRGKYNYMVGANITIDNQLVMSLTLDGMEEDFERHFLELKDLLKSEIGACFYTQYPHFEDGRGFIKQHRVKNGT